MDKIAEKDMFQGVGIEWVGNLRKPSTFVEIETTRLTLCSARRQDKSVTEDTVTPANVVVMMVANNITVS